MGKAVELKGTTAEICQRFEPGAEAVQRRRCGSAKGQDGAERDATAQSVEGSYQLPVVSRQFWPGRYQERSRDGCNTWEDEAARESRLVTRSPKLRQEPDRAEQHARHDKRPPLSPR